MKGLFLGMNDFSLERVAKRGEELKLLAKGDGTEVMIQKVQPGRTIVVSPGEDQEIMEFFYILKGSLKCQKDNETVLLKQGDYYFVHNLAENVFFEVVDETTLLYVASQPVFHFLSSEIRELVGICNKVSERDMYTHNHNVRVQSLALKVGRILELSRESQENLFFASMFSDVGKINIPDEILQKPGPLSTEEFDYVKRHPSESRNMIGNTYVRSVGTIVEQHHERLDGLGYPAGLKDQDILPEAKIIAVIDSYDAMTADRPYRRAMTPVDAMRELRSLAGSKYDSRIVNALEQVLISENTL